jgi:DNA-binding beta-propeller fold protein YncE
VWQNRKVDAVDLAVVPDWEQLPPGSAHKDVSDVAVDAEDRVYLLCRHPESVLIYDRDGQFRGSWGEGLLVRPHGLTIAPDGRIYVTDDGGHVVLIFDSDGHQVGQIGTGVPSETGFDESLLPDGREEALERIRGGGPFNRPTKAAVSPTGDVYVSDGYQNCRLHHFGSDGTLLNSWGASGIGPREFHIPHSVAIHPDGRLFVSDRENDRLQLLTPEGDFIASWEDVHRPNAVAFDSAGNVYVAELSRGPNDIKSWTRGRPSSDIPSRVSVFDADGNCLGRTGGTPSVQAGNFIAAHGIAVDSAGDVYVAEVTYTFKGSKGLVPADAHTLQKFTAV